jgi:hypothetical protein
MEHLLDDLKSYFNFGTMKEDSTLTYLTAHFV